MTPEQCTALAALLLDVRDWLIEQRPGSLDTLLIDHLVNVLGGIRSELIREGAK